MPTITTVDATWDTGVTMDASELRRADTAMFLGNGADNGVRSGIVRHGDTSLAVAVNGSDQVTVAAGAFVIASALGLGVYRGSLPAATSAVALTARNGTNPRIDLVVIQVNGTNATLKTIDGNPSSSPTAPALPAQHIELARLTVPQVGGGAVTVDSSWRTYATALGGTLYVETAARLPGSGNQKGQRAVALDTGVEWVWNGTAWTGGVGTIGYAQRTSNQGGITTEVDLTGLSVTVTTGASRRIRISVEISAASSVAGDVVSLRIKEGSTQLQSRETHLASAAGSTGLCVASVVLTPTAGPHTYKAALVRAVGTGTVNTAASATAPAYILVEDIGAV